MRVFNSVFRMKVALVSLGLVGLLLLGCAGQEPATGPAGAPVAGPGPSAVIPPVGEPPAVASAAPEASSFQPSPGERSRYVAAGAGVEGASITGGIRNPARTHGAGESGDLGIVAQGSGKASSAPDLAILNLGVQNLAGTVSEARTAAATAMSDVIAAVKEEDVAEEDIQTGRYSIQPRYTGREVTRCVAVEPEDSEDGESNTEGPPAPTPGPTPQAPSITTDPVVEEEEVQECFQEYQSVITGYEVSNSVTVMVRDLDTIDDVIDGAVEAGGDSIRFNGLRFSLEDSTDLLKEARASAVADMEGRAEHLATLSGIEVGALVHITEVTPAAAPVFQAEFAMARAAFDEGGSVSTPVSAGQVSVQVRVEGLYLIVYPSGDADTEGSANEG